MLVGELHRSAEASGRWLVLCHGMESTHRGTKQEAIAKRFSSRDYTVLRFDFSFVGESEGRFEDLTVSAEVDDVLGVLDFVAEFEPLDCTIVGSSLGGLVALLVAAQRPNLVDRVATIAAVADTSVFTAGLAESDLAEWRATGRYPWGSGFLKTGFLDDIEKIDALARISHVDVPLLVMHGSADAVVPVEHAALIADTAAGPVTTKVFDGVGHRFEEPGALGQLIATLDSWLSEQTGRG